MNISFAAVCCCIYAVSNLVGFHMVHFRSRVSWRFPAFWLICTAFLSQAASLPPQLASALERVDGGRSGAAEERVLRRYANEAEAGARVAARREGGGRCHPTHFAVNSINSDFLT